MDAATQDLVDQALREVATFEVSRPGSAQIIRAALEAAQRPQVSPEAREEMARTKVPIIDASGKTHWVDLGYECADAILARFSAPSQPVCDEEKIARWLHDWARGTPGEPSEFIQNLAAALVAALRAGELS